MLKTATFADGFYHERSGVCITFYEHLISRAAPPPHSAASLGRDGYTNNPNRHQIIVKCNKSFRFVSARALARTANWKFVFDVSAATVPRPSELRIKCVRWTRGAWTQRIRKLWQIYSHSMGRKGWLFRALSSQ